MLVENLSELIKRLKLSGPIFELKNGPALFAKPDRDSNQIEDESDPASEERLPARVFENLDELLQALTTGPAAEPVIVLIATSPELETNLKRLAAAPKVGGLLLIGPNPTHQAVVAQLLSGHSPDRTVLSNGYSQDDLAVLTDQNGWELAEANHVVSSETEQDETVLEADGPALLIHRPTLSGDVFRFLSHSFNPNALVEQWVWYARRTPSAQLQTETGDRQRPAISILIRTQGQRQELLTQSLYSIYVQNVPFEKYEVIISFQTPEPDPARIAEFEEWLKNFPPDLVERIRILPVVGQGATQPYNPLLKAVEGEYFFFLDDDDMLIEGYLNLLLDAMAEHGQDFPIFHTFSAQIWSSVKYWPVVVTPESKETLGADRVGLEVEGYTFSTIFDDPDILPRTYPYATTEVVLPETFYDPVQQYYGNLIPITNYVVPRQALEQTDLKFNPEIRMYSDWNFLMKSLRLLKIMTLPAFTTCISHRDNQSQIVENPALDYLRAINYERCHDLWSEQPVLLDGIAVRKMAEASATIKEQQATITEQVAMAQEANRQYLEGQKRYTEIAERNLYLETSRHSRTMQKLQTAQTQASEYIRIITDSELEKAWLYSRIEHYENDLKALQKTRAVRVSRVLGTTAQQVKRSLSMTSNILSGPVLRALKGPFEGAIDAAPESLEIPGQLKLAGWVVSAAAAIEKVEIYIGGEFVGTAVYGVSRPDVIQHRPWQLEINCGYTAELTFESEILKSGEFNLQVRAIDTANNQFEWSHPVTVKVFENRTGLSASRNIEALPEPLDPHADYSRFYLWIKNNEPDAKELDRQRDVWNDFAYQPVISIVTPVYNTPEDVLRATIDTVREQTYPNWELCLADGNSTKNNVTAVLEEYAELDDRIKVVYLTENGGISANTNQALKLATGEFIGLLDHDDLLAPWALFENIKYLNQHRDSGLVYSDEDLIDADGRRHTFFAKPDWSPELLYAEMYTGHFSVYRREIVVGLGGFRSEFDFSQDYDLAFRVTETLRPEQIGHIPQFLYHWRTLPGSAAVGDKPYARLSNVAAAADAMKRRGYTAQVLDLPAANRVLFDLPSPQPMISIIIPSDDWENIEKACNGIIFGTDYHMYEILVVTNTHLAYKTDKHFGYTHRVRPIKFDFPFNFSAKCNDGVDAAVGEFVVFYNDDVVPLAHDREWLETLLRNFQVKEVGAVGAKLLYTNGTIQHAGLVTGVRNFIGTAFHTFSADWRGYFNIGNSARTVGALSAACMMMRKSLFEDLGGFDEFNTPIMHSDIDLSFKIRQAGYRLVVDGFATLEHTGHVSLAKMEQAGEKHSEKADIFLLKRWGDYTSYDPYFTATMRDIFYRDYVGHYQLYAQGPINTKKYKADILVASHELSLTGAPIILQTLVEALKDDYYFTVVAPKMDKLFDAYRASNIPVILDQRFKELPEAMAPTLKDFDLIIANTIECWPLVRLAKQMGKPVLWLVHEAGFGQGVAQSDPEIAAALTEADVVILPSVYTTRFYEEFNSNLNQRVIHYGITDPELEITAQTETQTPVETGDTTAIDGEDQPEVLTQAETTAFETGKTVSKAASGLEAIAAPTGRFKVVHVGSVEPRKGQDSLVKAILELDPEKFEFYFLGRPLKRYFQHQLEEMTAHLPNVHWVGEASRLQTLEYMAKSSALVCTSRQETGPIVIMEAMGLAKPVISTPVGVMAEVIKDDVNGYLVPLDDLSALVTALNKLADSPAMCQEFGKASLEAFNHYFQLERYSSQVKELIQKLTGQETAKTPARESTAALPEPETAETGSAPR